MAGGGSSAPAIPAPAPVERRTDVGRAVAEEQPGPALLEHPGRASTAADCGRNDRARSFQVIIGTIASTRGSCPASSSASAPPYDPPTTPTRGSPAASVRISGRAASQSSSRCLEQVRAVAPAERRARPRGSARRRPTIVIRTRSVKSRAVISLRSETPIPRSSARPAR